MKKISIILAAALLLTLFAPAVSASSDVKLFGLSGIDENALENSGYKDYSISLYKDSKIDIKMHDTVLKDENLKHILTFFSDDSLTCTNSNIDDIRNEGRPEFSDYVTIDVQLKNSTYMAEKYIIQFDSEKVLISRIVLYPDPIKDGTGELHEGVFEFNNDKTYEELTQYIEALIPLQEEVNAKEHEKYLNSLKNLSYIDGDVEYLYELSFPVSNHSTAEYCGVCRYTLKNSSKPQTMFYWGYPYMNFICVTSDIGADNTVNMDCVKTLKYSSRDDLWLAYDLPDWIYSYKIQINVNEQMQADNITFTYTIKSTGDEKTEIIDMSKCTQTGKIPEGMFSPDNNIEYESDDTAKSEENTNVTKEETNDYDKDVEKEQVNEDIKEEDIKKEDIKKEDIKKEDTKEEVKDTKENESDKNTENKDDKIKDDEKEVIEDTKNDSELNNDKNNQYTQKDTESEQESPQQNASDEVDTNQDFKGVPKNHWAYKQIKELNSKKIVLGYGNGYFGVNDSVTYEQFALLLDRLFDYKADNTSNTPAIREEIIVSLVKAMDMNVSGIDEGIIEKTFSDCSQLKKENRKYIAAAIENGLVIGSNGQLFADNELTRAEAVMLLWRATK